MDAHEKRLSTFEYQFKFDPQYGHKLLSADMIDSKTLDKVIKHYAPDIENEKECVLGLFDVKRNPKGKKGILFTDYKMYCNLKKAKNQKIWYDEITKAKTRFLNRSKVIIRTDDGQKFVLKTTKRIGKKLVEFIRIINEYNGEITDPQVKLENLEQPDGLNGFVAGFEVGKHGMMNRGFEEEKFHAAQGHGFAAERANNMLDRMSGKNAKILGDNNVKNGPDRAIYLKDGSEILIQTKYCKDGTASINACFEKKPGASTETFRYLDGKGKPMLIEVPSDQYTKAVEVMEKKILDGKVPGVTDPSEAKNIVKKGNITYKQAVNIAKAGNIDSIMYDAANGIVVSASAFGISAVVSLATSIWNGDEFNVAVKKAATTGFKVGGASFLTSVLASQLSKAGLNSALVSSSEAVVKMMGSKTSAALVNAFRGTAKNIYGAAAMKSAAKLLRTNVITSVVMLFVFSIGDFINLVRRRITFLQFIKNFVVLALSIAAGVAGGLGGAALGTLILPGFGSFVGSIGGAIAAGALAGFLGKKLLGLFIKDDAEKMIKIINEEFQLIVDEYLLSKNEAEKVIDKLTRKLSIKEMRKMVASKDKSEYARNKLLIPITEDQVKKRKKIFEPSKEVMLASMNQIIESV